MSFYYKYSFKSPEGIFALVQEELKSYFDTGAIDTLLFNTYLDKALRKLGKGTYVITEETLFIEDFQARLPDNFYAVREAWMCTAVNGRPYQSANSFYSQAASETTIQVSPVVSGGSPCTNVECVNPSCNGAECMPVLIQAVYKTNNEINISYAKSFLLSPGNISTKANCEEYCANFGSDAPDSFDIRDNKFTTNFRKGVVHLVFYAIDYDNNGNQLIPVNYRIEEFLEHFIKYKMFETLSNQINDETFNQIQQKLVYYKSLSDEDFIMANLELQKETADKKKMKLQQLVNRNRMYELPNRNYRYGRRR